MRALTPPLCARLKDDAAWARRKHEFIRQPSLTLLLFLPDQSLSMFESSNLKIKRANRHIAEFEAEVSLYWQRRPVRLVVEETPFPSQNNWVIRISEKVPDWWTTIIGDAIHNLRAALDLLTCETVRLNNKELD